MRGTLLDPTAIQKRLEARLDHTFLTLSDLPSPDQFKGMERAVDRIVQAIQNHERIAVVGDYDVDGVIASAIVKRFFDAIGVSVEVQIPNRFTDGYGLSPRILDRIEAVDVILTVDNGIAAHAAAQVCRERGIDLIITDHHIPPETLPDAYAIVDQKQSDCSFPWEEVCGAQIAWYLCAALNRTLHAGIEMKSYLDMVAIAIIADMMPLQHINRTMVIAGLQQLQRSVWPFAQCVLQNSRRSLGRAEEIAFGLSPLLNSAGRLDDAGIALDFVLASDQTVACQLYGRLMQLNQTRKAIEEEVTAAAAAQVDPDAPVIVVSGEGWHEGVVGIAAARLARRFERPAIVLTQTGTICKGSGRSWRECHLYDLLSVARERLLSFGGHKAAIGMRIEQQHLDPFIATLSEAARLRCAADASDDPAILGHLPFAVIDAALIRLIDRFEPFGMGNPRPKFVTPNVTLVALQTMGKEGNHLRMTFESDGRYLQAVQFKTTATYSIGARCEIVYTLNENHFRGETTIQLMIEKITRI